MRPLFTRPDLGQGRSRRDRDGGAVREALRQSRTCDIRHFRRRSGPAAQTPLALNIQAPNAAGRSCIRCAKRRSSAARRTDSRTNSRSDIRLAVGRESFPRARSAWACLAECERRRFASRCTMPGNAAKLISGPLSLRIATGAPRVSMIPASALRHAAAGHGRVHLQRQTLSRVTIHDAEDPQSASARGHIAGEVDGPLLIRRCQHRPRPQHARSSRLRRVRRTLNPRSRYTRHTRLVIDRSPPVRGGTAARAAGDSRTAASRAPAVSSRSRSTLSSRRLRYRQLIRGISISPQTRRSLARNSSCSRRTSALRSTSPVSFFESPIAACPCPG